jgi:hypothetical protein
MGCGGLVLSFWGCRVRRSDPSGGWDKILNREFLLRNSAGISDANFLFSKELRNRESDESDESDEMIGPADFQLPQSQIAGPCLLPFVRFVRFVVPFIFGICMNCIVQSQAVSNPFQRFGRRFISVYSRLDFSNTDAVFPLVELMLP